MQVWLQSSDLSSKDFELDLLGSIKLLREHDWSAELVLLEQLESAGKEFCPPGAGFVHESGRILHVCPGARSARYYFHIPKKVLGFIPAGTKTVTHEDFMLANLPGLLTSYFNEEWERIE